MTLLYLADIVPETGVTPYLAGFERTTSPRTVTDCIGSFVFADIKPGSCGLVLDRVSEAYLLHNPDPDKSSEDFIIEANDGQIVDLGQLVYATLPGQGTLP